MGSSDDYLLGANEAELGRLRFQHSVWGPLTRDFLGRLGVAGGWKCLDVGAGPGLVAADLRSLVGQKGEVTALEMSPFYCSTLRGESERQGWSNVRVIEGKVEDVELPRDHFDLVFARWVLSFAPDPALFLRKLFGALRPGGLIALQDYYYEGLSLFPLGGGFARAHDVVVRYYNSEGGDPYVAGQVPAIFRTHGIRLTEFTPHCLAGGPASGVMQWADRFFTLHVSAMVETGAASQEDGDAILADWKAHRENPDALFFSPLVVDIAGQK